MPARYDRRSARHRIRGAARLAALQSVLRGRSQWKSRCLQRPGGAAFRETAEELHLLGSLSQKTIGMRVECPLSQFEQLLQDVVASGADEVREITIARKYEIPLHRIETLVIGEVAFMQTGFEPVQNPLG